MAECPIGVGATTSIRCTTRSADAHRDQSPSTCIVSPVIAMGMGYGDTTRAAVVVADKDRHSAVLGGLMSRVGGGARLKAEGRAPLLASGR